MFSLCFSLTYFWLYFQSADEKLRSLGHKGHHSSKSNTSIYCGVHNVKDISNVTPSPSAHSVTSSRSDPPDVPPPPIPSATSSFSLHSQEQGTLSQSQQHLDAASQNTAEPSEDIPPPLFPKPRLALMAERRLQRQNRKSGVSLTGGDNAKRRSRSEGPQGRRRTRNSMHETSSAPKNKSKNISNGRYSMYTGHLSDEDDLKAHQTQSASDSPDSDEQKWTKNPLMARKSRKCDTSKTDKRRSLHNVDRNGQGTRHSEQVPNMFQNPEGRDLFIAPRKPEVLSNKAKFLRMEENRKKRIDMAVTSDEECSPQLRISRLRQRAMRSSNLQMDPRGFRESINIVPIKGDNSQQGFHENGFSQTDKADRVSVYDDNRLSRYDENFNIDNATGNLYQDYTKQQGVRHNKLPNVLPEYLPANRIPVNRTPSSGSYDNAKYNVMRSNVQNENIMDTNSSVTNFEQSQAVFQQNQSKFVGESQKMRSFNEVKSNKPAPVKKAVEKIELVSRSPNSSSDSLDDLIESNIQYLESEIESGKLKRQSGNYGNYQHVSGQHHSQPLMRDSLRNNPNITLQDEFMLRLQDPRSQMGHVQKVPSNAMVKASQKSTVYSVPTANSYGKSVNHGTVPSTHSYNQTSESRHLPISGSATYSPYMQRKHVEPIEDMSKSDSQLNKPVHMQVYYPGGQGHVPYPVLNQQTGNIMYVQQPGNVQQFGGSEGSIVAGADSGMFSDVEYNIEVSERIKKWEKKLTPGEMEEKRKVLNTIKEYESFSDSNQKDSLPDTPLEIRRELRQLLSPTDNSGVGKLSVSLTKSNSSISDANEQSVPYYEPKVVSSETNLHRIFRVVREPKGLVHATPVHVVPEHDRPTVTVQSRRKKPHETTNHASQSMSNVTLSESEIGSTMQQSWPPIAVDSDSGVRKSWRTSRYEDEISELKEIVSDNFRDIRKKFDSDVSEPGTRRATSPVTFPTQKTGTATLTLNIQPVTPTKPRSPVTIRRKLSDQSSNKSPPASPNTVPLTPKSERKLPVYRSVPVETRSQLPVSAQTAAETKPSSTPVIDLTPPTSRAISSKPAPEVWSPNMESRKGLVSIERVKARTLQTIPFSEDPVWKEIEGLATFEKPEDIPAEVTFNEIDELLKLATGGVDNIRSRANLGPGNYSPKMMSTDMMTPTVSNLSYADNLMTSSYNPNTLQPPLPKEKPRKLSDSAVIVAPKQARHTFTPPVIKPLKLNSKPKTSTSALDEVLEDIRATLQKKPLSPKLMKNFDTSESNSSTNRSLQSPLTKSSKSFVFPKDLKGLSKTEPQVPPIPPAPHTLEDKKSSAATPGYDNTHPNWQPQQQQFVPPQNAPYIDPEFTQYPYIINGNYHLDPNLLSEKLKSTGLVNESSDEHSNKALAKLPANHKALSKIEFPVTNQYMAGKFESANKNKANEGHSKSPVHDLDQSVDELRALAQEVEHKLNQIKSRIVAADEDRLDNILVALRKFAPMTEQKYFNVKFTPDFESEKVRRSKLEEALNELDKMYESLNLNDEDLLDRAERRETALNYEAKMKENKANTATRAVNPKTSEETKVLRKSQIDEIERQTQNEFEDITKSFQVLLDEVTKQCRSVAQSSSKYNQSDRSVYPVSPSQQYSSQRPPDEVRHEPPRHQLKHESQSPRAVQDSYNTAIKELESVAMGNIGQSSKVPLQSSAVYLNIDKSKLNNQRANEKLKETGLAPTSRNLDIQVGSKSYTSTKNVSPRLTSPTVSQPFMSMATEFKSKPTGKEVSSQVVPATKQQQTATLQVELNNAKTQSQGRGGRFRKRGNIEHRKSMPAMTRTVETQTVETQTDNPPSEIKEKFEQTRKSSLQEYLLTSTEVRGSRPYERKLSSGITKVSDLYDSSEDEQKRDSKIRHSLSAPDIVSLLDCLNEENLRRKKDLEVNLSQLRRGSDQNKDMTDERVQILGAELGSCVETPKRKPPVYPVWQYPGQMELPMVKKSGEVRKLGVSGELVRTVSDTESDVSRDVGATAAEYFTEEIVIRRRTRSMGAEQEDNDRPRSFHELVATFEKDPKRLEKLRLSGLRKCASEDSMFTDFILQKIYHSESDLYAAEGGSVITKSGSSSGLKLALEMRVQTP